LMARGRYAMTACGSQVTRKSKLKWRLMENQTKLLASPINPIRKESIESLLLSRQLNKESSTIFCCATRQQSPCS
jgi:hypothetical protein